MSSYFLFLIIATLAIISPGPGVTFTLTNGIRLGAANALSGILGVASGTFIVACLSATGLGVIIATSTLAFNIVKLVGALYLIYMGIRFWRAPPLQIENNLPSSIDRKKLFVHGFSFQLANPKVILFFMAVLPQFVDLSADSLSQFLLLVVTYCVLLIILHMCYVYLANSVRAWLSGPTGSRVFNRLGGGAFMCFGVGIALSSR